MGHVNELAKWLSQPLSRPPVDGSDLAEWSNNVAGFIASEMEPANEVPRVADVLASSGELRLKRLPADEAMFEPYFDEERQAMMVEFRLRPGNEALEESLRLGLLRPAMAAIIGQSECSRCGASYRDCDCSKLFDADVVQEIKALEPAGFFWTDRLPA